MNPVPRASVFAGHCNPFLPAGSPFSGGCPHPRIFLLDIAEHATLSRAPRCRHPTLSPVGWTVPLRALHCAELPQRSSPLKTAEWLPPYISPIALHVTAQLLEEEEILRLEQNLQSGNPPLPSKTVAIIDGLLRRTRCKPKGDLLMNIIRRLRTLIDTAF
uniref:Uncharacterized protein n=1 Tax=Tetraselmis sp. GSL018 TaxID=582737 RepID=A0A061SGJ3_9CHLO